MSEMRMDCSLDLMRRLPPQNCEKHLIDLIEIAPDLCENLLSAVDQPLKVAKDKATGREYLLCDYNRDCDSYRLAGYWKYLMDGVVPSDRLRKLEVEVNAAFESYRDMYFEGGVSSVYFWDIDSGFAGVCSSKKETESGAKAVKGCWDSIHVLEVNEKSLKASKHAKYKLDCAVNDQNPHLVNIGKMVEELESKMRSTLNDVYFGKAKQIVGDLRTVETTTELRSREELVDDLKKAVSGKRQSKEDL
uniref:F-actin-capping protein subunit beta n=1 Tax=Ditylenchus dipsaci TaxID=166011 RepID=A0A915D6U6_9BILA